MSRAAVGTLPNESANTSLRDLVFSKALAGLTYEERNGKDQVSSPA